MTRPLPASITDILVVCSGNICRSPMAAAYLRAELVNAGVRGVIVHSAGTIAAAGNPASPEAIEAAEEHDLDISYHRSTPLTRELVRRADLILAMEKDHVEAIRALEPSAADKSFVLSEWLDEPQRGADIPDPYGMAFPFYELVFARLRQAIDRLVVKLKIAD
jgi:protein-tyrosine-phosphatase